MTAPMPILSFVIPTYNGRSRIGIPLQAIAGQDVAPGTTEVIVVDNASTDGTGEAVESHPARRELERRGVAVRVVREERPGASLARIRGVLDSRGELVCLLDDDTAPEPGYAAAGIAAFMDPQVGLLISRLFPKYEVQPTASITRREHLLAINSRFGDQRLEWTRRDEVAPTITAGMWVRRSAFLHAVPWQNPERLLADRQGKALTGGGDIEFGYLIGHAGYKRVYLPELRLIHHIPAGRVRARYMWRLIQGIVRSEVTFKSRYGIEPYGELARLKAMVALIGAVIAAPALLLRPDGPREALFVIAARWARVRGPFGGAGTPGALGVQTARTGT